MHFKMYFGAARVSAAQFDINNQINQEKIFLYTSKEDKAIYFMSLKNELWKM